RGRRDLLFEARLIGLPAVTPESWSAVARIPHGVDTPVEALLFLLAYQSPQGLLRHGVQQPEPEDRLREAQRRHHLGAERTEVEMLDAQLRFAQRDLLAVRERDDLVFPIHVQVGFLRNRLVRVCEVDALSLQRAILDLVAIVRM